MSFETDVTTAKDGRAKLVWRKVDIWRQWAELSEGCYLLRTNVTDWSAEEVWQAYIQLTDAEAAFRIHKTDLRIRPIWHQKQERVDAHILVCFLAYTAWKTLGQMCKQAGLGDEPRRVLAELSRTKLVDVVLPTRSGRTGQPLFSAPTRSRRTGRTSCRPGSRCTWRFRMTGPRSGIK